MSYIGRIVALALCLAAVGGQVLAVDRKDIGLRDPFVYCDKATGRCYLYATCGTSDGKPGFDVRETADPTLQTWSELKPVWRKPPDFWGVWAYWAPEVFLYKGKYYLFATFEAPGRARAVQILSADSPEGPFHVHSPQPITGPEYFSLDGTLYIDKHGDPWMVYSREHVSVHDGQMRAVRLKPDLTAPLEPLTDILLFKASSATYAAHWTNKDGSTSYLTDGPQMLRLSNGDLVMAWSTNNYLPKPIGWGYTVSIARSTSGEIQGPWVQEGILYNGFAGHGEIFRHPTLGLVLCVHQPNRGRSYPLFLTVYESKGKLTMADPATPDFVQAYWRFEDCTPGRTVLPAIDILDSSGKGNHLRGDAFGSVGTASTSVSAARIPATTRLNLECYDNSQPPSDGADARYLRTAEGPIMGMAFKSWTVEASVRPADLSKPQVFICRECLMSLGTTPEGHVEARFKGQSVTSRKTLSPGKWYNIAVVSDGVRLRLYTDDGKGFVLDTSAMLSAKQTELSKGQWTIGCGMRDGTPADQFTGLIDEVRISAKALMPGSLLFGKGRALAT
jgi:arabinan endo-1,5-alpha-L-arabinosidase